MEGIWGWIVWLVEGAVIGWIASLVMGTNAQMGLVTNIIAGLLGAVIGGWISTLLGVTGWWWGVLFAIIGAAILIWLASLVFKPRAA